ncbi:hypothetical protein DRH27_02345 [Candidatus Falkowbacteria bacterium]|nr:MAG: hypothetical protein DRH27_02345 [Candidatus Falkowbacteria bacterium]
MDYKLFIYKKIMPDDKKIEKKELSDLSQKLEINNEKKESFEDIKKIEKREVLEKIGETSYDQLKEGKKETEKVNVSTSVYADDKDKSEAREKEIEKTLEAGLEDFYINMPEEKRREFKRMGEETAGKINKLLEQSRVKAKKIVKLIKKWLLLIPGINKFFLEQEVKIKTDRILKLKVEI